MKHVVVWDPEGTYWEGAVVEEERSNELAARGVVSLPCVPENFGLAGFSGYAKRSWGSGYPLDAQSSTASPLAIFAPGDPHRSLHWAARLVSFADAPETRTGQLRLAALSAYWTQNRGTVSEAGGASRNLVEIAKIGKPDEHGGWSVGGKARLDVPMPGFYGLGLYGAALGMRVAWLAVTLTP